MVDLSTRYLGLTLRSPIVASASPLNAKADSARRVEDAGAGAIVLPSLFEEEIVHEELEITRALENGSDAYPEALSYFPDVAEFAGAGERYLRRLEGVKSAVSVPVIASLNAGAPGVWARYARWLEEAGADAIELNLYRVAADPTLSAADVERRDLDVVAAVRAEASVPLAVKISPFYSSPAAFARQLVDAGADGLVLFNRFYSPDLDLLSLDVVARLELSRGWELRLPLRWIAILRPQLGPAVSLAATSGIATGADVVKALMVGADVAMTTSSLLRHGPAHLANIEAELRAWLAEHGYGSVADLRGSATRATAPDAGAFERANYVRTISSWGTGVG